MPMLLLRALRGPRGPGPDDSREYGGDRGGIRGQAGCAQDRPGRIGGERTGLQSDCVVPHRPGAPQPNPLEEGFKAGTIKIEMNPQGILAERIRAGGAGSRRSGRRWELGLSCRREGDQNYRGQAVHPGTRHQGRLRPSPGPQGRQGRQPCLSGQHETLQRDLGDGGPGHDCGGRRNSRTGRAGPRQGHHARHICEQNCVQAQTVQG